MLNIFSATPEHITRAAGLLQSGGLVAFATETVYGLGADAANDTAVAAIYAAKGRPTFNPLIVHVRDISHAAEFVEFTPLAEKLTAKFWPGALTLVLKRKPECQLSLLLSAGLDTVAVRCPNHPAAQALLQTARLAIAAPSANKSGHISPTTAAHVAEEFTGNEIAMILDEGNAEVGIESTVIDATGEMPVILRYGSILPEYIAQLIGKVEDGVKNTSGNITSPGQMLRHYAPRIPLRINVQRVNDGEALLAFGDSPLPHHSTMLNLSRTGNLTEAAANLFAMLRALDTPPHTSIAVMPIPHEGLGIAINDRLKRAAE